MNRLPFFIGLSLLYSSAYFLGFLTPYSLYFVPDFFGYVVLPSLACVAGICFFLILGDRLKKCVVRETLILLGSAILTIVALKSMFDAAGYPWVNLITLFGDASIITDENKFRTFRIAAVLLALPLALLFIYFIRRRVSSWLRLLSTAGYAFLFLSIYRCLSSDLLDSSMQAATPVAKLQAAAAPHFAQRRVVWLIFDEMDYGLSLGKKTADKVSLPNFHMLSSRAVTATHAFTPGKDTLYSIPALLSGTRLTGAVIHGKNRLSLIDDHRQMLAFDMQNSIFSRIPGGPAAASVEGFYHPYCEVLPTLQQCHSTYLGNAGRWFDSFTFFSEPLFSTLRHIRWMNNVMPEWVLYQFDPMYRSSKNSIDRIDGLIANTSTSFSFIHLNVPHLPNVYVQRLLKKPVFGDEQAYEQNLQGADIILGRVLRNLEKLKDHQEVLVVVSSDHWLRAHSNKPDPVPFIIWKMGEKDAMELTEPLTTVYTQDLALDFLNKKVSSQADISEWWRHKKFYPTWSAPNGYRY